MNETLFSQWVTAANHTAKEATAESILLMEDTVDHIGIKCASVSDYQTLKLYLQKKGVCLGEVPINGRPIATFLLTESFLVGKTHVNVVEIMAPKSDATQTQTRFDHIEVVLSECFADRRNRRQHGNWSEIRWPSIVNPELVTSLPSGDIKFHFSSLKSIIELEHKHSEISQTKVPPPNSHALWIFDLDGTLVNSFESVVAGLHLFAKTKNLAFTELDIRARLKPTYDLCLQEFGILSPTPEDWLCLANCEVQCVNSVTRAPTIIEMLSDAKASGLQVVVWTARFRPAAEKILSLMKLDSLCDKLITASEIKKPSRIEWISAYGKNAILVGDSSSDFQAAQINGIDFLQVPSAHQSIDSAAQ